MTTSFLSALLAFAVALTPLAAAAKETGGQIVVSVDDALSRKPLASARVELHGTGTANSASDRRGVVRYTNVPAGSYRVRVMKAGYSDVITGYFDVEDDKVVNVRAALAGKGLRVIGTVSTRSAPSVTARDTLADGTTQRVSDSLLEALDKSAGVTVDRGADGSSSISLHGHDGSQTGVAIDGVPLVPPGTSANLRAFGSDLFAGAQVDFGSSSGSLGGLVNFQTLQPTQTWRSDLAGSMGTFDRAILQLSATGRAGAFSVAAQHSERTSNSPETFDVLTDQSGLSYPHGGEARTVGDLVKLQYRFDDRTTVSALGIVSNGRSSPLCVQFGGNVPCGFGPGNTDSTRAGFGYGRVQTVLGSVTVSATAAVTSSTEWMDAQHQQFEGTPFPETATTGTVARTALLVASAVQGRHTLTLTGSSTSSKTDYGPARSHAASPLVSASAQPAVETWFRSARIVDSVAASERLTLNGALSVAQGSGLDATMLGAVGATWRPRRNDLFEASFDAGSAQPVPHGTDGLSEPLAATYDCTGRIVTVSGGADTPRKQSAHGIQLGWSHSGEFGRFRIDAYRQTQSGQPFSALVNGQNEPAGLLTGTYLQALNDVWRSPLVCGSGAPVLAQANVFIGESLTSTSRVYEGIDLSGRIALGRRLFAYPAYALNVAKLTAADQRLTGAFSTFIVGSQLPGRPLHRIGLTLVGEPAAPGLEVIANAQWTGAGNSRQLGAYTTVNAGVSERLGPGRVTLFATNLFNAKAGTFATAALAQAQPTTSGAMVVPLGYPLQPRTINLGYQLRVGGAPPESPLRALAGSQRSGAPERGGASILTGSPRAPRPQFGPAPAGSDPLSLATYRPACDPEAQRIATGILSDLRSYVTAFDADRTPPAPHIFTVVPRSGGERSSSHWFELRAKPAAAAPDERADDPERAVGCFYISNFSNAEARARGVVTAQPAIGYSEQLGLFYVQAVELPAGGGSLSR